MTVVVIGAGIGGLTAAALLLKAGHRVTVLEAHTYPGGSAGTFYHQGYRFDAGATLAGGFNQGGPHARLAETLDLEWPVLPVDPAWVVHLPDGRRVTQWADRDRWRAEWQSAFPESGRFWRRQERLASIAWDVTSQPFPWPPSSAGDVSALAGRLRPRAASALPFMVRTIADIAPVTDPMLLAFLDSQLLISAQTTSDRAGALYGSAALDLPRRGVNHVIGGMGALADTLVTWIRAHGGEVHFRQRVVAVDLDLRDRVTAVTTKRGLTVKGDAFLANLTPWGLSQLLGERAPVALRDEVRTLPATWGAFTLYLGVDASLLAGGLADHHQVIVDHTRPLGEGNSVFLSLAEKSDVARAPAGLRPMTLSTHTAVEPWWRLREGGDEEAYLARREAYTERLLSAAERAVPNLRQAIRLVLPGTPVTFQRFTGRPFGMVGGFPQTSLFNARGPQTGVKNLWLVGDSIFPGQSTAGVTLGAMRVAAGVNYAFPTLTPAARLARLPA